MTPTLLGRLETRAFVLLTVGLLWTLVVTPVLPADASIGDKYETTITVLLLVVIAGMAWEFLYHGLMQFRWEKDWPAFFGLLTGINEGIVVWFLARAVRDPDPDVASFLIHFSTTWLVAWLFVNGPIRVPFLRWRFRGGRLV
jgi:hypothetical protein